MPRNPQDTGDNTLTGKPGDLFRYAITHAPWALITSLSAGLSNYIIIILLSQFYSLATAGQFRLLLSIVAMLSMFTLLDTGKILIRSLVVGAPGVVRRLLINRIKWSFLGVAVGLATAAALYNKGSGLYLPVALASFLLPFAFPTTLYLQINQAQKNFRLNAIYSSLKFTALALLPLVAGYTGSDATVFFLTYYIVLAAFHSYFMSRHEEAYEKTTRTYRNETTNAAKLSASGIFPIILEHADKFLISYFLGLEALGVYTIGVSTGRLVLHFIKPVMTVFFPVLVKQKFEKSMLLAVFIALTSLGLLIAVVARYYFEYVLGPVFIPAFPLAAVIVAGLGIHFVGVIVYYSSIYHEDANLKIPMITNIATFSLVVLYLLAALRFGGDWALLLCAASYPIREVANVSIITLLNWLKLADEKSPSLL